MKSDVFMGLQKVFTVAGLFCLVIGAFASLGWLIRDVLGYELGFQGSFFPFVMLTVVGAGFVIGSQREP
jgi:hypothetical protein